METALPEVFDSELDAAAVDALFRDLAALASPPEISLKHGATRYAEQAPALDLVAARSALLAGDVRAVQIRYLHEGKPWCDTLTRARSGFRLIRIAG